MDVIYPDQCLVWLLQQVALTSPGLTFHLYNNHAIIGPATQFSDLNNADSVFPPQVVLASQFTFQQVSGHVGVIQAPNLDFTNLSGVDQIVWGFYATDGSGLVLVQVAQFDGAPVTIKNGETFAVAPVLGGYSGNQS